MLKIAVCDDEKSQLEKIHLAVQEYFAEPNSIKGDSVWVTDFSSSSGFLGAVKSGEKFNIALLDICMPEKDGVQLAKELLILSPATKIIFLTASRDYAVDAFLVGAVHYLVKPFEKKDFAVALERAVALLGENHKKIVITEAHSKKSVVCVSDIICIESIGYERIVTTKKGVFVEVRRTLRDFLTELNRLSPGQFILPYRGYVINLSAVRTVLPLCVEMEGGIKIPLKRGDFNSVKNAVFDYSFVGGGLLSG